MSIRLLYVEGKLDSQILNALVSEGGLNGITISDKGSKEGLQSRVVYERERTGLEEIFYLRDRDFDFDVCLDVNSPIEIKRGDKVVGWHWCRHEIENYLLEPMVLSQAFNVSEQDVVAAVISAANLIRTYEVARWTLGHSKRRGMLPPHYDLYTRPEIVRNKELSVPIDWSRDACFEWVMSSAEEFLGNVDRSLNQEEITNRFNIYERNFTEENCSDINWVLHSFSGKDLFFVMTEWFKEKGIRDTGTARDRVKLWIVENPAKAIECVTEFREMLELFRAIRRG